MSPLSLFLGIEKFVDLLYEFVGVCSVNCASLLDGFSGRSGATEAMHTDLKEKACCFNVHLEHFSDNCIFCYFHFYLRSAANAAIYFLLESS